MSQTSLIAVVLSAGQGSRMHSGLPKSLHPVAGQPILARILRALRQIPLQEIRVVINEEHKHLMEPLAQAFRAKVCCQNPNKKGTGTAVLSALQETPNTKGPVLIVNGDHPLLSPSDLKNIVSVFEKKSADLCFGSFIKENPGDYGRVIRQAGEIKAIAEKSSFTPQSEKIKEVNTGLYLVKAQYLHDFLPQITNQNPKGEYGLTDIVSLLVQKGKKVLACPVSEDSALGVNTQKELAFVSKKVFTRKLNQLMQEGVVIVDPLNTYIEDSVFVGQGSVVYPGTHLRGKTSIGSFCAIENNSFIMDSIINDFVLIRAGSYLESAEVGAKSAIGPYARLRPGTKIGQECRVGNFAELKKTHLGIRSKAGHFSYLGDTKVGEDVNIGAGVVTCNLNISGQKNQTTIKDKVFVGSGTYIVAPVTIEEGSATGAGSVVTKDVPANTLSLSRTPQKNIENYFHKKTKDKK